MAKSFFERITGSLNVRDDTSLSVKDGLVSDAVPSKPLKNKETRLKAELRMAKRPEPNFAVSKTSGESSIEKENVYLEDAAEAKELGLSPLQTRESSEYGSGGSEDEGGQLIIDVYDDGSHIVAQSTIAGVSPEDLDISVADGTLTIRGTRRRIPEVSDDRFYAKELYWGNFSRSVILPEEVDGEKTEAGLKNGLLTLRIPKKSNENSRKIKIRNE